MLRRARRQFTLGGIGTLCYALATIASSYVIGWVTDDVNTPIATVPGSYQDELGCPGEWAPDCLRAWLQDPDGDGLFVFQTDAVPAGEYEAKVAVGLSWARTRGPA